MPNGSGSTVSMAETTRRAELFEWMKFCKEKIEPFDRIWSKRLEDVDEEEDPEQDEEENGVTHIHKKPQQEDDDESEVMVKNILKMANNRRVGVVKKSSGEAADIRA